MVVVAELIGDGVIAGKWLWWSGDVESRIYYVVRVLEREREEVRIWRETEKERERKCKYAQQRWLLKEFV